VRKNICIGKVKEGWKEEGIRKMQLERKKYGSVILKIWRYYNSFLIGFSYIINLIPLISGLGGVHLDCLDEQNMAEWVSVTSKTSHKLSITYLLFPYDFSFGTQPICPRDTKQIMAFLPIAQAEDPCTVS
jgi:hypothetical protein